MVLRRPRLFVAAGLTALIGGIALAGWSKAATPTDPKEKSPDAAYVPRRKGTLTFARDIAPILYKNCATCHHPGEVAPFPLLTYQEAKLRAAQIASVTQTRFMPPWKLESHGEFLDERRLTPDQIGILKQWADEGAKEGPPAAIPAAPKFRSEWALGPPDAVLMPARSYTLAAEGPDVYRCFVIPTNTQETRYLRAFDVRPGNRAVVHHVIAFLDTHGKARQLEAKSADGPGYTAFGDIGFEPDGALGGWVPGNTPHPLPDGVGIELPKGADIVLQVHYHKDGKSETDQTKIALYFATKPVDKRIGIAAVINPFLNIAPGKADYTTHASLRVPEDVTVWEITPHMHLLGKTMRVSVTFPDGTQRPLVDVNDWDFNWQGTYAYKEPIKVPKGSRFDLVATYDNSENNPRNPSHPPRQVRWGEQTTDEMCIAFLWYTFDREQLTKGIAVDGPDWF